MKVIVAHPGRQHSYRVATALKKAGMLEKYVTTVYNKDDSILMRLTKLFIKGDNLARASKRKCPSLKDEDVVQLCELQGLMLLLLGKIDKNKKLYVWYMGYVSRCFQRKLAKYIIRNNVEAVISYDTNSEILWNILKVKAPSVIRIMDHAHPSRNYLFHVYRNFMEPSGEFVKTFQACGYLTDKKKADSFGKEIRDSQYHIVASTFSLGGTVFNNIPKENVFKIPYGVNLNVFKPAEKSDTMLKILFVGEVNQRKGIYEVLKAAKKLQSDDIEFNIVGRGREYYEDLYLPYNNCANFYGHVGFGQLISFYSTSHVFVFPTLGEGFGLVVPEALSAGLPVITTNNCVGSDLIEDGVNGFIIPPCDTEKLVDRILYLKEHRKELKVMSEEAILSVRNLTWENYEQNLIKAIQEIEKRNINV